MAGLNSHADIEIDDWELSKYLERSNSHKLRELGVISIKELDDMLNMLLELKKITNFKPYSHEAILLEKLLARYEQ